MSHSASHAPLRVLDALSPGWIAEESDPTVRIRARQLVLVVIGTTAIAVATVPFHWLSDNPRRALFHLACTPLALWILWMLREPSRGATGPGRIGGERPNGRASADRSRRVGRALAAFLSILLVALSIGPLLSPDGFAVPVAMAVLPFLAATIGGTGFGGVWTAITLAVLGVMTIGVSGDPARALVAWNAFLVAGVVGVGGCLVEAARERARRDADAASRKASWLARSQEETESELRSSREILAHAFRRMPAMFILSELATGRIVDVNECFERISGWTLAEARGRTLAELNAWVSPEDRQRLFSPIPDGGKIHDFEILLRKKSGSEIWLLVTADILEMNGKRHILAQGVDISDRKRAEQALVASRKLLEDRVVERSERLRASQLELRRQRQLASIGTLAAGVAHQINNPIASIMAAAEYALLPTSASDASRDEIRDDALRSVISEAVRCGQIVKNVLRFARQQPTARWVEDLVPVVRRAATLCRDYVTDHGGELRIETDGARLPALVSPIEIEQVVVNLVRNAAEALEGGGRIRVGVFRRETCVEISIDDEGRGMPRELLDRLFEPFYTTRIQQGGTGLGLSFSHGVIIDHGGEIRVESEVGKGTRIRIRLPLAPPAVDAISSE